MEEHVVRDVGLPCEVLVPPTRGDYLEANAGANANQADYLQRFTRAFDLANVDQNRVKLTVDWAPSDNVGVAIEYQYKDNDYNDTTLGRTKDTRNEIFANLTYGTPNSWRATLFGDYEDIKYDSDHRYVAASPTCTTATGPNCHRPNTLPATAGAYNWSATVKNKNWMVGLGLDVPFGDRWTFTGSLLYEETDGSSDMTAQNNFGNPLPLPNYPNIKMTSLNLKGVYKVNRNWSTTVGYAYQKYDYVDDQYTGYTNTMPVIRATTGANTENRGATSTDGTRSSRTTRTSCT